MIDNGISKKKKLLMISSTIGIFIVLLGITYAWFNYRQEGTNKKVVVGNIYLTLAEGQEEIDLENVFPMTTEEARDDNNDNYMTFSIDGVNTTGNDLYYEIKLNYGSNISGYTDRFRDSELVFDLVELDNNDNEVNYLVNARSYDDISNGIRIWVNTIDHSTSTEIHRKYKLRMWLSDDILISDTDPNATYPATGAGAYKNYYASVKLSVYGDFVEKEVHDAYSTIVKNVKNDTINFGAISSDNNGKGVYLLQGPETNNYPIYYYRGAVDNNIIFAGMCWKMVRTTETGGVKIIYNGEPTITGSGDDISYDCSNSRPSTKDGQIKSTLGLGNTNYYYSDDYEVVSISSGTVTYRLKSKTNPITQVSIANTDESVASNIPTIAANYPYTCRKTTSDETCTDLYKVDSYASSKNAYVYIATDVSSIGRSQFNGNNTMMNYAGYMYNKTYTKKTGSANAGAYFGSGISYDETNNVYTLTDATVTDEPDNSHHYTCNSTNANASCNPVRYYFSYTDSYKYYIELTDGETVEDALYKMTGTGTSEVKSRHINQNYELNVTDSIIKTNLENWFQETLTNEIDNTKTNYQDYLEDTVFCYDRTFQQEGDNTLAKSGWNPNVEGISGNGNLTQLIFFGARSRIRNNNWHSTTNRPLLTCPNETDRFSVSNSKAHLNYPVGLLTVDEVTLAGQSGNTTATNNAYYLYTGIISYWLGSPSFYSTNYPTCISVNQSGYVEMNGGSHVKNSFGLRPVVSLKSGIEFEDGGDGTDTNPYVVKINSISPTPTLAP